MKTNTEDNNKRIMFVDIAKGIAILLMIIGHVTPKSIVRNFIFSFHMPLFIITSGYFFKDSSFTDALKKIAKLLIPTALSVLVVLLIKNIQKLGLFNSVLSTLQSIVVGFSKSKNIIYDFNGVNVLWFVYLLVVIRILFLLNTKFSKNNDFLLLVIILLESYLGYLIGTAGYWLPWSFDVALVCMLFYFFGYIFKKYNLLDKLFANKYILILIFLLWIIGIHYNSIELANRLYPKGLWSYITAICGSLVIFKFSMFTEQKLKHITAFLSWCGKNSLYLLIGHFINLMLIKYNMSNYNKTLYIMYPIMSKILFSLICALIIIYISRIKNKLKTLHKN